MPTYQFSENNSGGSWWLARKDYDALMAAGWTYTPSEYDLKSRWDTKPYLGDADDTVPYGWRHHLTGEFPSIRDAVESFEKATGQDFFEEGCNCCGAPFSISGNNEYLSGDSVRRQVIRPW